MVNGVIALPVFSPVTKVLLPGFVIVGEVLGFTFRVKVVDSVSPSSSSTVIDILKVLVLVTVVEPWILTKWDSSSSSESVIPAGAPLILNV